MSTLQIIKQFFLKQDWIISTLQSIVKTYFCLVNWLIWTCSLGSGISIIFTYVFKRFNWLTSTCSLGSGMSIGKRSTHISTWVKTSKTGKLKNERRKYIEKKSLLLLVIVTLVSNDNKSYFALLNAWLVRIVKRPAQIHVHLKDQIFLPSDAWCQIVSMLIADILFISKSK